MKQLYALEADGAAKLVKELMDAHIPFNLYTTVNKLAHSERRRTDVNINLTHFEDMASIYYICTKLDLQASYSAASGWKILQWKEVQPR